MLSGIMANDLSLREFVTTNNLPARVKVTEGMYLPEWEFSNGDVLDLIKLVCPAVELSYISPDTGDEKTISVSTQSPCLFKIMPYIPDQPMIIGKPMVIRGTVNLIKIWPSVVCTRTDYEEGSRGLSLVKGEKLRLKRLKRKRYDKDEFVLECSLDNSRLVALPMSCDLEFSIVEDTTAYTLTEIAEMQGRVERRLRLSEDNVNKTETIHGLSRDFVGDLIMFPARRFVEIHPESSPGEQMAVPLDLDISVSERDSDYSRCSFTYYDIGRFVDANSSKFPMVVSIAEWGEQPVTVQAIRASVGDRIILHKVENVMKMACEVGSSYFVIPLSYDAVFQAKPNVFSSLGEACLFTDKKIRKVRVMVNGIPELSKGDVIEIHTKQDISGVVKVNKEDSKRQIIKVPMDQRMRCEEVLDLPLFNNNGKMTDINSSMLPITVVFPEPAISFKKRKDAIPRDADVRLLFIFKDSCVITSKNIERSLSSPIPTRTDISIRYISQYKKDAVVPQVSGLASCPELIFSEDKFLNLQTLMSGYENSDAFPETAPPPLAPRAGHLNPGRLIQTMDSASMQYRKANRFGLTTDRVGCPLPDTPGQVPSGVTPQVRRTQSVPGAPPIPARPSREAIAAATVAIRRGAAADKGPGYPHTVHTASHARPPISSTLFTDNARSRAPRPVVPADPSYVIEDEIDYEEVGNLKDYSAVMKEIFGDDEPPSVTTPADANLSRFSWAEIVVFLQLTGMTPNSLRRVAQDKLDGRKFSRLDRSQLKAYGIDYPIIRHYWNKSKPAQT